MHTKLGSIITCVAIALCTNTTEAVQTIHNQTNRPLYMAGYVTDTDAVRKTDVIEIGRHTNATITEPSMPLFRGKKRYIAVSDDKDDLSPHLRINYLRTFPLIDISSRLSSFGGTYYVVDKGGRLQINTEYSRIGKFINAITKNIKKKISGQVIDEKKISALRNNPHQTQVARVRTDEELPPDELNYLKKRAFKVQEAFHSLLPGTTERLLFPKKTTVVPRAPVISVVLSGGGNRAMFSSCGFMQGLQEIGVLDATTYIASLSGSTWFLGSWFASNESLIAEFRQKFVHTMTRGILSVSLHEYSLMFNEFKLKYLYHQPITSVDLLGALLGNALFREYGNKRYNIYLSDQKSNLETGDWPFPIYTAVDGSGVTHKFESWYEFTPYEVGGPWLNAYVPTWAFGRKFAEGKSVDDAPEMPLAFLFGIFGSATSVDGYRAWQEMEQLISINAQLTKFMHQHILDPIGHMRITEGREFNFTAGMPKSPLRHEKYMSLVDGGFGHNLPYPVVSGERKGRTSDILIFFDASSGVSNLKTSADAAATQLRKAEKYARSHGLRFPHIEKVLPKMINIYKNETDPSVPVVMWIPCTFDANKYEIFALNDNRFTTIKDFDFSTCSFCATTNFIYTPKQADQLATLGQFCAHACQHEIIEAIAWKMEQLAEKVEAL